MADTRRSRFNWTPVDEALVRLVYQNRHIMTGEPPAVTRKMKSTVWQNIANSLTVRRISNKLPTELRDRWYRIRDRCVTDNPTGKDIIIRAILDNSDGCLCECATVFHLHENASNQQVESGPVDQHSADTSDNQEELSGDEESVTGERPNDSLSGLEENDLDMECRELTRDKLKLEVELLKLKIESRREDSHPPTS